jgi:ACDE family multidrug resistance protein
VVDLRRLAIYCGAFIGPLSGNAVLSLVPVLKDAFHSSAPDVIISVSFFMLPFAFFMLFTGSISDVLGRKFVLSVGFVTYALGGIGSGLSPNVETFYLFRFIQGFGFAFVQPTLIAMLGDIVPSKEVGRVMGIFGAASTAGIALGPFVAGFIAVVDWRLMFFLVSFLAILIYLLFLVSFRGVVEKKLPGGMRAFRSALIGGFRYKSVIYLSLAGLLTFLCYGGTLSFISDTLSIAPLSFSPENIGIIMAGAGLAGMFIAPIGGAMVDRMGRLQAAGVGIGVMVIGFLCFTQAGSFLAYLGSMAVLGSGVSIVWSSLLTLTVEVVPERKGTVSSIFNSARYFGYSMAPVVFTPLYLAYSIDAIHIAGMAIAMAALAATFLAVRNAHLKQTWHPNPR